MNTIKWHPMQWDSTENGPPEAGKYLITLDFGSSQAVDIRFWNGDEWIPFMKWDTHGDRRLITAWAHLPEPYVLVVQLDVESVRHKVRSPEGT